jgi:ubiquinone/menaquinone biosynthesis C-methylase UbiE
MHRKDNSRAIAVAHQKVYDAVAEEYEQRARARSASSKRRVERFAIFVTSGQTVLELGCAVGQELQNFNALGFETTGVELSSKMAAFARRRNPNSKIIMGDFAAMEFTRTYDAVYAQAFIHLFPKREAVVLIKKVFCLLKPDGVAFFGTTKANDSKEPDPNPQFIGKTPAAREFSPVLRRKAYLNDTVFDEKLAKNPRPGVLAELGDWVRLNESWLGKADYKGNPERFRRFWTKAELEQTLSNVGFTIIDYYEELGLEAKDRMNITVRRG